MQHNDKNIIMLGEKIKELRKQKNESLNKFALEKGKISISTLCRIENGIIDIKFKSLLKISSALGITINELLKDIPFDYEIYGNE
jgi:transcriptional regulator with XRE-family HTH domain